VPGSPCIGKASDGGDIGCRFTPEMIELCKVALDLRRRGILPFPPNPPGFPDPYVQNFRYPRYDRRKFLKSQVQTNRN
jgi:hypothetical protein